MQRRLFAIMSALVITAAVYASPLYAQQSQSIGVKVPFAFSVNGKVLPAGNYRIGPINDNREVWGIQGIDVPTKAFLLALSRTGNKNERLVVAFHRYNGRNFLSGFMTAAYEVTLPESTDEKALRNSGSQLSEMQVIEIGTDSRPAARNVANGEHE